MPKLWLISSVVTCSCLSSNLAQAQVIPDGTTANTDITGDCLVKCNITGGIQAESNLFHSFQEFNVGRGESIYFVAPGIANIFSRVTGSNSSQIFGTLGVTGDANLWLLNPQGIIFGNGATLDVNGSFVATTADEIVFGDRGFFSVNPDAQENLPLLTVNPSAFFYHQMGQNNPILIEGASLAVPAQESIVLMGARNDQSSPGILIQDSTINAPQGNIQLGAVAADGIVEINSDLQLQFSENIIQGKINLAQDSEINAVGIGGGAIAIQAAELNIIENSRIFSGSLANVDSNDLSITTQKLNLDRGIIHSFSLGTGKSSDITINTESLNISGGGLVGFQELVGQALSGNLSAGTEVTGITTYTNNLGAAGNIAINSESISINNGAFVASATYNQGRGGDIDITATETIELSSSSLLSLAAFDSLGKAGDLTINAQNLIVQEGSLVSAATLGQGAGGDITIKAEESVTLLRSPANFLLPTVIFTNSIFPNSGDAGNLVIDTKNLILQDGSQISSASGLLTEQGIVPSGGAGGDIQIQASESVTISGSSPNNIFPSSILSDTRSNSPAGNINIDTGTFLLEGQAIVSASSIGTGDGGNLTINAAESIQLNSYGIENLSSVIDTGLSGEEFSISDIQGGLFSITLSGNAGDISLNSPLLSVSNGAVISTTTLGSGTGGSLDIEASQKLEIMSSLIASSSLNTGDAGNIAINTSNLIIGNGGTLTTSTIGLGKPGNMIINATELVKLTNDDDFLFLIPGGIFTNNSGGGLGRAGDLLLNTKNLIIRDGLEINIANENLFPERATEENQPTSSTSFVPQIEQGNSIINATESIEVSGNSANGQFSSRIKTTTETNFPASNLQITTPQLTVSDGANIAVSSESSGAAASLEIIADRINLKRGGTLNADTLSGKGGNINLTIAEVLQLSDRAGITTNARNQGDGGNITIDTEFLIAFPHSSIMATAIAGNGGNIEIMAQELFVASSNQITASSQLGIDGEVNISSFNHDFRNNLTKLPEKPLKTENQVVSYCGDGDELAKNSFVYIGKGALPPSPLDGNFYSEQFLLDWGDETSEFELHQIYQSSNSAIVEATSWIIGDRGKVILTAEKPPQSLLSPYQAVCPFSSN